MSMGLVVQSDAEGMITVPTTDLTPPHVAIDFIPLISCLVVGAMVVEKKIESLTKKEIHILYRNHHVTHARNKKKSSKTTTFGQQTKKI